MRLSDGRVEAVRWPCGGCPMAVFDRQMAVFDRQMAIFDRQMAVFGKV